MYGPLVCTPHRIPSRCPPIVFYPAHTHSSTALTATPRPQLFSYHYPLVLKITTMTHIPFQHSMVKGGSMAASPTAESTLSYSNSSSAGSTESFSSDTSFGDSDSVTDSIGDHLEYIAADSSSAGEVREREREK